MSLKANKKISHGCTGIKPVNSWKKIWREHEIQKI
jgi:hypothetical protein